MARTRAKWPVSTNISVHQVSDKIPANRENNREITEFGVVSIRNH